MRAGAVSACSPRTVGCPQAQIDETFGNPQGCWDWWRYLGVDDGDYATRSGPQMATVMNMVTAVGG